MCLQELQALAERRRSPRECQPYAQGLTTARTGLNFKVEKSRRCEMEVRFNVHVELIVDGENWGWFGITEKKRKLSPQQLAEIVEGFCDLVEEKCKPFRELELRPLPEENEEKEVFFLDDEDGEVEEVEHVLIFADEYVRLKTPFSDVEVHFYPYRPDVYIFYKKAVFYGLRAYDGTSLYWPFGEFPRFYLPLLEGFNTEKLAKWIKTFHRLWEKIPPEPRERLVRLYNEYYGYHYRMAAVNETVSKVKV
jgi:hypothetical protein